MHMPATKTTTNRSAGVRKTPEYCDGEAKRQQDEPVVEVEERAERLLQGTDAFGDLERGGLLRSGGAGPRLDGGP